MYKDNKHCHASAPSGAINEAHQRSPCNFVVNDAISAEDSDAKDAFHENDFPTTCKTEEVRKNNSERRTLRTKQSPKAAKKSLKEVNNHRFLKWR